MWPAAVASCSYDLENEPLYHNNTFFACRRPDFSSRDLLRLKDLALDARRDNDRDAAASAAETRSGPLLEGRFSLDEQKDSDII